MGGFDVHSNSKQAVNFVHSELLVRLFSLVASSGGTLFYFHFSSPASDFIRSV
jgi:hypothetical protein